MSYISISDDRSEYMPNSYPSGLSLGNCLYSPIREDDCFPGVTQAPVDTAKESFRAFGGEVVSLENFTLYRLLKRIRDIAEYKAGWDGTQESEPASQEAIDEAELFLSLLPLSKIEPPIISFASDGEINFYWSTAEVETFDIGFYGEGAYSFYYRGINGEELFGNDLKPTAPIPDLIINKLSKETFG